MLKALLAMTSGRIEKKDVLETCECFGSACFCSICTGMKRTADGAKKPPGGRALLKFRTWEVKIASEIGGGPSLFVSLSRLSLSLFSCHRFPFDTILMSKIETTLKRSGQLVGKLSIKFFSIQVQRKSSSRSGLTICVECAGDALPARHVTVC